MQKTSKGKSLLALNLQAEKVVVGAEFRVELYSNLQARLHMLRQSHKEITFNLTDIVAEA